MHKWYDEEYAFTVEVTGFLRGDHTEGYCRNGEEIGDRYACTYGCPVNAQGQGICSKTMMMLFPLMEAVRSGGDLENLGGDGKYTKQIVCPDGCVIFRLTAEKLGFIAQEMGREINTLGSKSNHAEMQKIVVQMKDELEQIKEQVLNVM